MAHTAVGDGPTKTIGHEGQITISREALGGLGLRSGDRLLEVIVGGLLVYIPASADVLDAHDRFVTALEDRGVTTDDLIAELQNAIYDELYGAGSATEK